jgi:hypothetical protein
MPFLQKPRVDISLDLMPQRRGMPHVPSFSFNGVDHDREQKDINGKVAQRQQPSKTHRAHC